MEKNVFSTMWQKMPTLSSPSLVTQQEMKKTNKQRKKLQDMEIFYDY